jgi:hypothetical protein
MYNLVNEATDYKDIDYKLDLTSDKDNNLSDKSQEHIYAYNDLLLDNVILKFFKLSYLCVNFCITYSILRVKKMLKSKKCETV